MQFSDFSKAVASQFALMQAHGLFRAQVDKEALWDLYLASYPAGSNPIYKTRGEYDCNCCKSFIRQAGKIVSIINGQIQTIWDIEVGGPFQIVADAMAALVRSSPIDNVFLSDLKTIGTPISWQLVEGQVINWNHFSLSIPAEFVVKTDQIGPKLSEFQGSKDVFLRSLRELTLDSLDTVLDLIDQNSLYRGEEQRFAVTKFRNAKKVFSLVTNPDRQEIFAWANFSKVPTSVARIRNTAIGTLLVDLSEGKDLEFAVKAFEKVMAPANYKRPTALVTPAMIRKAQEQIEELGFTSALERRYATIQDITINNILFADRSAKRNMNVFDELAAAAPQKVKNLDKVEEVNIEDFIANVLPRAQSVEVLFENRHAGNLISLVAPVHSDSTSIFKWSNNFSWSYAGEMTDSIKERVKKAGGNVTGDLCCRLAWDYSDDLDFHMAEPGGSHIYYVNRRENSRCGGKLDLDANGADGQVADPAENIFYSNRKTMREGLYTLSVNNFQRRSLGNGFEVEIEFDGQTHHMVYDKPLRTGDTVEVARIQYSKKDGFAIISSMPSVQASKTVWSLPTQTFHKVNVVMLSPNQWDNRPVGNKHYFFMLEGCLNEGKARGFFNEFLNAELNQHRKVLEVVGSKMKTEESDRQLSGLGFSSTQRNHLMARVKGSFTRTVKVTF